MTARPSSPQPERSAGPRRFRALFSSDARRPLVIAHRGASCRAPENTLEAARLGWEAGADAWEFDVQLSRDGVPIVFHDESLRRTTDVAQKFARDPRGEHGFLVADFDLDEILSLDAGAWFIDPAGGPRSARAFGTLDGLAAETLERCRSGAVRVPTLAEALALTQDLDWLANVELKTFPRANPAVAETVLAAIDHAGTAEKVLVSSFDHRDVAEVARLRPDLATGVLTPSPLHRPEAYVREIVGADSYHPSTLALGAESAAYSRAPSSRALRAGDVASLRERGVPVLVFTVNDLGPNGLAVHLAQAGVSGFFTDDPGGLLDLFRTG